AAQVIWLRQRLSVHVERPATSAHRPNPDERTIPMTTATLTRTITPVPDYAAIKQRQQATWAAGDYAIIGTTLQIVGERICEAIDLRAGERVLTMTAPLILLPSTPPPSLPALPSPPHHTSP